MNQFASQRVNIKILSSSITGKMTNDKKSIKDINKVIEAFEKRINTLEDIVNKLQGHRTDPLENQISISKTKLNVLLDEVKRQDTSYKTVVLNCKECEETFSDKRSLKDYMNIFHMKKFNCKFCDTTFGARWSLEAHMDEHETRNEFKCQECDKEFHLKWRLEKHIQGHQETDQKLCRFYNNNEASPYEAIGCKLKHKCAAFCNVYTHCINMFCQFRHSVKENNSSDESEDTRNEDANKEDNQIKNKTIKLKKQRMKMLVKWTTLKKIQP